VVQTSPGLRCSGPACADVVAQPCKAAPQASSRLWPNLHGSWEAAASHCSLPAAVLCYEARLQLASVTLHADRP
jgi:hypothetical protein